MPNDSKIWFLLLPQKNIHSSCKWSTKRLLHYLLMKSDSLICYFFGSWSSCEVQNRVTGASQAINPQGINGNNHPGGLEHHEHPEMFSLMQPWATPWSTLVSMITVFAICGYSLTEYAFSRQHDTFYDTRQSARYMDKARIILALPLIFLLLCLLSLLNFQPEPDDQ